MSEVCVNTNINSNMSGSLIYSLTGDKDKDEKLLQPYNYIVRVPEEKLTTKICRSFNHWLNIPEEKLMQIDHIVYTLFWASILIDDVQDNSTMRKGVPASHTIFGLASTINAGLYAESIALEQSFELGHPDAPRMTLEYIMISQRGQGMEIYWRDSFTCPTEEEYMEIATAKTAMFRLIMNLMQLFSENKQDYTAVATVMGIYMQIYDDYLSLFSKQYMDKKGYSDDIIEGKFSFPLIHAIRKNPDDRRVANILNKRTSDKAVIKYCISLLEECGSREYTRKKLVGLGNDVRKEMKHSGDNPYIEHLLDSIQSKL